MGDSIAATTGSTSHSLVRRAQQQDPDAWQRLSELYVPLVYEWARQTGLQSSDASDVVQEVFRAVSAKIGGFHREHADSSFRGWLWTITRNHVRLHFRRLGSRPQTTGGSEAQQQLHQQPDLLDRDSDESSVESYKGLVNRALRLVEGDFEPKTWQAFWRLTVDGHSAAEIADDLGMNPRSVRQAKYRVLSRLRQELEDD
ncbi:MAG: sigma-70 family RNA polymerase sigma factor [Planctomycetes bacterium]|nr:sigma-70 family RNA polymerase sigma factor [Planctomycetota bacterium]